jgi:tripartite ATP-independent transporter DctM subunit
MMAPHHQAIIFIILFLGLVIFRVPVAFALIISGFAGLASLIGMMPALALLSRSPMEFAASWELSAVPMFLLMGTIVAKSGIADALFDFFRLLFSRLPGGLAIATNFSCAGFGAASGSSLAATVGVGRLAVPYMERFNYDRGLIGAVCGCGGTLAALIPPSIPFIVFAILTEQSALTLFTAGIVPGLLTAFAYAGVIMLRCALNPSLAGDVRGRNNNGDYHDEDMKLVLFRLWPITLLAIIVIAGLYAGFATPTEAGGLGACTALSIAVLRRSMSVREFYEAVSETAVTTAAILIIAVGASVLTAYLAFAGFPSYVGQLLSGSDASTLLFIVAMSATFLLLGMILDPLGVMLLATPIFLPAVTAHGYELVWFAVIVVKFIEIGLITPPVGLNLFAAKSLLPPEYPFSGLIRAVFWFLLAEIFVMSILLVFPQLSLWLPNLLQT